MEGEAKSLVKALRDKEIKWEEYSRALLDKTLVSALAAVYLGAGESDPRATMERAWPTIVGEMTPPLKDFLDQTEGGLNSGQLILGDQTLDFADEETGVDEEFNPEDYPMEPIVREILPEQPRRKNTWMGVYSRVKRYISTPTYAYFALGKSFTKAKQGYKEMRRIAVHDSRTCPDCRRFDQMGWQPLGSLPMPGRECRCFDRCRCAMEYR